MIHPLSKEVSQAATAGTQGTKELIKKVVPPVVTWQSVFPDTPEKIFDSSAPQGEPNPPDNAATSKKDSLRSTDTKRQIPIDSQASAKTANQVSAPPQRKEKDFLVKGQEFIENGIAFSESKKGRISQSPDPKVTGVPETSRKEAEELEPGKAIEWLLEKKGFKKE